jgi:23S rRNA (adenine2503-C2)-methyltransferase
MKQIEDIIQVPTGQIIIMNGEKGYLECLSLADYGKAQNIKADFLGLERDLNQVNHCETLPLTEKWVVTISTQYGCAMNCKFCDVPLLKLNQNATYSDLKNQILASLSMHPEVLSTKRLNVHYARMGEPTFNQAVIDFTKNMRTELRPIIGRSLIHPVVSTMMPKKNKNLVKFLNDWVEIKNYDFRGDAGLQLSINSTNEKEREEMFSNNSLTLKEISEISKTWGTPKGRKFTLNFAVANYEIDENVLKEYFNPTNFIIKLTPMHKTISAEKNDIKTKGEYDCYYPYQEIEKRLKKVGFDVLVFIASKEEDESRITCGNAILGNPFL